MEGYQRSFVLFVAPLLILVSGLITAWILSPEGNSINTSFLLMYLFGLGSFWGFFVLFDRFGMFNHESL